MPWSDDPETLLWSPPVPCRACGYPMPRGLEACPACGEPHGLAPALRGRRLVARMSGLQTWLARRAADLTILAVALGVGTLVLPLSPLLVLFPILLVAGQPTRRRRSARRKRKGGHPPRP